MSEWPKARELKELDLTQKAALSWHVLAVAAECGKCVPHLVARGRDHLPGPPGGKSLFVVKVVEGAASAERVRKPLQQQTALSSRHSPGFPRTLPLPDQHDPEGLRESSCLRAVSEQSGTGHLYGHSAAGDSVPVQGGGACVECDAMMSPVDQITGLCWCSHSGLWLWHRPSANVIKFKGSCRLLMPRRAVLQVAEVRLLKSGFRRRRLRERCGKDANKVLKPNMDRCKSLSFGQRSI